MMVSGAKRLEIRWKLVYKTIFEPNIILCQNRIIRRIGVEMKIDAIMLDPKDNVVTCVRDVAAGETVCYRNGDAFLNVDAKENIPFGHKIALEEVAKEAEIYKYGELIGKAMSPIGKGCLVDHKNIYSVPRDYESEYVPEA